LLSALILLGATVLLRALRDGEAQLVVGDTRLRLLAVAAVPVYVVGMYWPPAADFFRLQPLSLLQWSRIVVTVVLAYGVSLLTDWCARRRQGLGA
jgi:hypothetical protein